MIALALPYLERRLVYSGEDADQMEKLQNLSERLLTRSDLLQLLEAILASTCDYLRVSSAFVASRNGGSPDLVSAVGSMRPSAALLYDDVGEVSQLLSGETPADAPLYKWHNYWIAPLYSIRGSAAPTPIGVMGIQARSAEIDLTEDELSMLRSFVRRAAQALDDVTLQGDIYAALEGLLPQIRITRSSAADLEYRPGRDAIRLPADDSVTSDDEQFKEQVRAALRHYWGGPGLSSSRLLELYAVRAALPENDQNSVRALRAVLQRAIEAQKPEGERKKTSPEWTIYNILDMRFIQRMKVKEVAIKLAMSEPDLYRKQRVAIDVIADWLLETERNRADGEQA
jgi:hypothetical protein